MTFAAFVGWQLSESKLSFEKYLKNYGLVETKKVTKKQAVEEENKAMEAVERIKRKMGGNG